MGIGVGTRIDRYTLLELLGEGGQGAVWKVEDPLAPGELRALKLVGLRLAREEELERLRREARTLARLEHPSLCRCHGLFEDLTQEVLGFSMDYVAGRSLGDALSDARLSGELREQALLHVTRALAYVHEQGAVHRDVKLANVLLEDGFWKKPADPSTVKLVDFGIAALDGVRKRLTATGFAVGTPAYMAPEQIEPQHWGAKGFEAAADLFGLGVLAWKLFIGGHPTGLARGAELGDYVMAYREAESTGRWPPKMPTRGAVRVYRRCLALHPQDRYASAGELGERFAKAIGQGPDGLDGVTGVHGEPKEAPAAMGATAVEGRARNPANGTPVRPETEALGRSPALLAAGRTVAQSPALPERTQRASTRVPDRERSRGGVFWVGLLAAVGIAVAAGSFVVSEESDSDSEEGTREKSMPSATAGPTQTSPSTHSSGPSDIVSPTRRGGTDVCSNYEAVGLPSGSFRTRLSAKDHRLSSGKVVSDAYAVLQIDREHVDPSDGDGPSPGIENSQTISALMCTVVKKYGGSSSMSDSRVGRRILRGEPVVEVSYSGRAFATVKILKGDCRDARANLAWLRQNGGDAQWVQYMSGAVGAKDESTCGEALRNLEQDYYSSR